MMRSTLKEMLLYDEYACSKENVIKMLSSREDILQAAQSAITIGHEIFLKKAVDDPLLYEENPMQPTALNAEIKKVFNELIKDISGITRVVKNGFSYYIVDGTYFLFIKKLNKSGFPSYADSISVQERMSSLPCAFIGPRIDNSYYIFGGAYVSVISSKDSVMWLSAISDLLSSRKFVISNHKNKLNIEDIITVNAEKLKERNLLDSKKIAGE